MLKILHNVSLINWRLQEMTDTDGLSFEFEKGVHKGWENNGRFK